MLWQCPTIFPSLANNQIHVWRVSLERSQDELIRLLSLLDLQEKERAANFIVDHARNNFIATRGSLRILLARYLQVEPQDLVFRQNQYGKLFVALPQREPLLQFNISHSRDLALFAFSSREPVGIDVEFIRDDFEYLDIAQRFFSIQEYKDLVALPKEQQLLAFFNCWSRKEAFIKALGKGLFCKLDRFSVAVSNKKVGQLQLQFVADEFSAENWVLEALDPGVGYVGALAVFVEKHQANNVLSYLTFAWDNSC